MPKLMTLALAVGAVLLAGLGQAQTVAVDYSKAHLSWTEPTLNGVPTAYTVKCGTATGGPYTLTTQYPVVGLIAATGAVVSLSNTVKASGTYFCVVSASNATGESANSTELTFQAGLVPSVPASVAITVN